jgi:predicted dehydrogenase
MSVRLGIIGAGGIGAWHAKTAAAVGIQVAGVFDPDGERARAVAAEHGGAFAVTSLDELLRHEGVDAIAVASPNAFHCQNAVAALLAGKDVLLEKPMARDRPECDRILEARQRSGRLLQMGFVCRYATASVAAAGLVASGRLCRIYHVKASLYRQRGIPGLGRWFTTARLSGGGVLVDLGVHLLDLALHLSGHPRVYRAGASCTSVFGAPPSKYRYRDMWAGPPDPAGVFDVEDGVVALVRCDTGLTIELNTTWASNIPGSWIRDGVLLLGDQAACWFNLWSNELVVGVERDGHVVEERPGLHGGDAWVGAWHEQYRRFADSVQSRTPPAATGEQGRAVQAVLDALYRSSRKRREVEVDL